jgi:hypothetical protein
MAIGERAMKRKQPLLTAGVSSATTAITIQMIPLRVEITGKSRARYKTSFQCLTWFHKRRPKDIVPSP